MCPLPQFTRHGTSLKSVYLPHCSSGYTESPLFMTKQREAAGSTLHSSSCCASFSGWNCRASAIHYYASECESESAMWLSSDIIVKGGDSMALHIE